MGCSISCAYFEMFSSFLHWVLVQQVGVDSVVHYLDDFLFIGAGSSGVCARLKQVFEDLAEDFGVPLARDKSEGPVTSLVFLGIELDTEALVTRLPLLKVRQLLGLIEQVIQAPKSTLHTIQSLLGSLNFACRVLPMGRAFSRRLAASTSGVRDRHHFLRLPAGVRADLRMWAVFLRDFNGTVPMLAPELSSVDLELFSDAAGGVGFGLYCNGDWCAERWPAEWVRSGVTKNITLLELFPLLVACELWSGVLRNRRVVFWCDNLGVVEVVNRQAARCLAVNALMRELVLRCLRLNLFVRARHVPGLQNGIADALSRFNFLQFRRLAPGARAEGSRMPARLWSLVGKESGRCSLPVPVPILCGSWAILSSTGLVNVHVSARVAVILDWGIWDFVFPGGDNAGCIGVNFWSY
uniref:Uncharacterized protein LOC117363363 isoform X1 n=1 Tax=Geotrypetes seraphini TaxID=260995 RepID=A0A6P8RN35_GEOSA|nr:uncharacterized protein LOC117363363 isoform X1 [Geotrypetes seraphini]